MHVDTVIAQRFRVVRLAGGGGMGSVYEAIDLERDVPVAVKVARHVEGRAHARRLIREARALAERLADPPHPGIVDYVDHGVTEGGEPYLVMGWLNGCDLAHRLRAGPLAEIETVRLAGKVCRALAHAHARGIVHRDIKPSNLFLVDGDVGKVKLVDFGLAWMDTAMTRLTASGVTMGTPSFISPEQARSGNAVDPRTDLYSLGATLFNCLTRRPPFTGAHVMAILAKLLLEPAPRVRELRADVSAALDELIDRLMAKDPAHRPGSAEEVLSELEAIRARRTARPAGRPPVAVSGLEQRYVSLVMMSRWRPRVEAPDATDFASAVAHHGAQPEHLADGMRLAVFSSDGDATTMATRAARCALDLHARSRGIPVVLATGRELTGCAVSVGEVIDRAAGMFGAHDQTLVATPNATPATGQVVACDVTRALLETRFRFGDPADGGHRLLGEKPLPGGARWVLGKPTRCVGRDRELHQLEAIYDECVATSSPRAVVVTAPPGAGKSRLAHELIGRLGTRDDGPAIWLAHGDSIGAGSSLGLLGQCIRHVVGVAAEDSLAARMAGLADHVGRRVPPEDAARVAAFLGEIAGVLFPDGRPSAAARGAPGRPAHARSDAPGLGGPRRGREPVAARTMRDRRPAVGRSAHGPVRRRGAAQPDRRSVHGPGARPARGPRHVSQPVRWPGRHPDRIAPAVPIGVRVAGPGPPARPHDR